MIWSARVSCSLSTFNTRRLSDSIGDASWSSRRKVWAARRKSWSLVASNSYVFKDSRYTVLTAVAMRGSPAAGGSIRMVAVEV